MTIETTKIFDRSNIQEWPNPKPLSTERVSVTTPGQDGKNTNSRETGFIRNSSLHPVALTERW